MQPALDNLPGISTLGSKWLTAAICLLGGLEVTTLAGHRVGSLLGNILDCATCSNVALDEPRAPSQDFVLPRPHARTSYVMTHSIEQQSSAENNRHNVCMTV